MVSDADFQFIVGTVLGQKRDSPLFKALEKAGISDVGGITSLTDQAIDRLTYRDDSSGTPINEELGHGYQQLIRCFNAFALMKNDEGKPIHGDWQNLTMTAEFQEFRIIGFALYTMTQGPACYQDVDDVLDLSYVAQTSEDIEVDDILDLSYVPNTAEDIVLTQAPAPTMALIDQGDNGGITGIDTRVIEYHPCRTVDICGMDNHEITSIPIGATAGAVARSQWGGVILIMHQYPYHPQQGRSIHSSCRLESFANDGNDKMIHIPGGLQQIQTVDGYVFPLSIQDGFPYLGMRPYTDVEYESTPHVILTSDVTNWDPRILDFDIDDDDDWYDAILDNMNHSELVDAFSNYTPGRTTEVEVSSTDTWFDTVTPDHYARLHLEEATIVCSEHAYCVQHFDNDDFDAVLLVNDTELVDTTGPVDSDQDMPNTKPDTDDDDNADARGRISMVQGPDYDKLRPLFGWMNTKTIKKTLEQTTQYARTILKKHYKSPFPALNVQRRDGHVAMDTVYSDTPVIDGGEIWQRLDPLDGENLPQSPRIVKSVQDDTEDVSDQVKPMIYFDTGDFVGRTFLKEEDDDGLPCCAHIIEVLDDHKKNVANEPVLKKCKCLVGEDEFEEILSYNEVMQHIEKDDDDGETFWKYKRISGHEGPLNKNHSSWKEDKYNVKVEWENGEVSCEPLHTIAADDPVTRAIYAKDHGLLDTSGGWKCTGLIQFHLGCDFFRDKEGVSCFAPRKYIDNKLIASYEHMSGSKPVTNKITSPLVKGDHPEIDDSAFLDEEVVQQYQTLIGQLLWAILLGRFDIAVAITMTMSASMMSAFRSAPRKGHLNRVKRICDYLSKMRHSVIRLRTEEPDYSDIPRTEYDWEFSVYRGAKEELPYTDGWKRFQSLAKKKTKTMLRMVNQSKLRSYKTCKKYMYGFEIPRGYEDPIRLDKVHGNDKWQRATKLEMDQLHEYDTFHDKGIGTTPGEAFKKIPPSSSCVCVQAPDSILFGSLGSDNISILFPYVDKRTRAHVI